MIQTKDIKKWCKALRSGKYEQGVGSLQSDDNKYCCLGVACKIFAPSYPIKENGLLNGCLPQPYRGTPRWLYDMNEIFRLDTGKILSSLNDEGLFENDAVIMSPFTFDEIADLLEAVYIHKVLD